MQRTDTGRPARGAGAFHGAACHADTRTGELARSAALAADTPGTAGGCSPTRAACVSRRSDALNLGLARRLPVLSGLGYGHRRGGTRRAAPVSPRGDPAARDRICRTASRRMRERSDPRNRTSRQPRAGLSPDLLVEILRGREAWLPVLPGETTALPHPDPQLRARLKRHERRSCRGISRRCNARFRRTSLRDALAAVTCAAAQDLRLQGSASPIAQCSRMPRHRRTTGSRACLFGVASPNSFSPGKSTWRQQFDYRQGIAAGPGGQVLVTAGTCGERRARAACRACDTARLFRRAGCPSRGYDDAGMGGAAGSLHPGAASRDVRWNWAEVSETPSDASRSYLAVRGRRAHAALGDPDAPTDTAHAPRSSRLRHVLVDDLPGHLRCATPD